MPEWGARFKAELTMRRNVAGISFEKMCESAGIDGSTVSDWFGMTAPKMSVENVERIADAATGLDSFRAYASYRNETYWFPDGENALFTGNAGQLAEFVTGDVLLMNVDVVGSLTYDTQVGGSTTAPLFRVVAIPQSKPGAC